VVVSVRAAFAAGRGAGRLGRPGGGDDGDRDSLVVSARRGSRGVLPAEAVVDLEQHLLLALGQALVGEQGVDHEAVALALLEDAGLHVQRLGRDAQRLGDLLQDLGARLAQAALDLAEVGVADTRELGQLPQRDLAAVALLADVVAEGADVGDAGARGRDGRDRALELLLRGALHDPGRRYAGVLATASASASRAGEVRHAPDRRDGASGMRPARGGVEHACQPRPASRPRASRSTRRAKARQAAERAGAAQAGRKPAASPPPSRRAPPSAAPVPLPARPPARPTRAPYRDDEPRVPTLSRAAKAAWVKEHRPVLPLRHRGPRTAVLHLGPTNSGKTHDSVLALAAAGEGVYAAPLRQLAHEAYARLTTLLGPGQVGLSTGEEEIDPGAPIVCCTVDKAPRPRAPARARRGPTGSWTRRAGHHWTRLALTGAYEHVHVISAAEAAPALTGLLTDAEDLEVVEHRRLSALHEVGAVRGQDVEPGTLVVAFSRKAVYAVAGALSRWHAGRVGVLYGALPPATRRAVIDSFTRGELDVLVTTDVIGTASTSRPPRCCSPRPRSTTARAAVR
jgi:hypothetical protein